jgi:hypothetical protein
MSQVNLSKPVNWLDKVNMLTFLLDLRLQYCQLSMQIPPVLFNANSSSTLSFLDLSVNHLNSFIFPWLLKYTNGHVHLDLSSNNLECAIPDLTRLSLLNELHLSNNQLNGSLDNVLEKLYNLQVLDASLNSLKCVITEAQLNVLALRLLGFSYNSLSLKSGPD